MATALVPVVAPLWPGCSPPRGGPPRAPTLRAGEDTELSELIASARDRVARQDEQLVRAATGGALTEQATRDGAVAAATDSADAGALSAALVPSRTTGGGITPDDAPAHPDGEPADGIPP